MGTKHLPAMKIQVILEEMIKAPVTAYFRFGTYTQCSPCRFGFSHALDDAGRVTFKVEYKLVENTRECGRCTRLCSSCSGRVDRKIRKNEGETVVMVEREAIKWLTNPRPENNRSPDHKRLLEAECGGMNKHTNK
jgi:hypothetical protein